MTEWKYYRPQDTGVANLALMRRIDERHLDHPFAGDRRKCSASRMLRDMFKRKGHQIGRKH